MYNVIEIGFKPIVHYKGGRIMTRITLRAARVNAGFSQEKAAALLNISPYTLSNWERGISMPKANQIEVICNLYVCFCIWNDF